MFVANPAFSYFQVALGTPRKDWAEPVGGVSECTPGGAPTVAGEDWFFHRSPYLTLLIIPRKSYLITPLPPHSALIIEQKSRLIDSDIWKL